MKKITIVDYGSGNVLSAQKSFAKIAKDNNIEADVLISKKLKLKLFLLAETYEESSMSRKCCS